MIEMPGGAEVYIGTFSRRDWRVQGRVPVKSMAGRRISRVTIPLVVTLVRCTRICLAYQQEMPA